MNENVDRHLERLTDQVLASYGARKATQRIGHAFLPSREMIVETVGLIRELLFPGYFGHQELTRQNVKFHVGNLLVRAGERLTEQVYHCMCYGDARRDQGPCPKRAAQVAHEFLGRIGKIRRMLALDAQAAYDGDPAAKSTDEVIYCYPGFYAVTVYRVAHELLKLGVPLMPRIMTEHAHSVTGCDIHPGAEIGGNFFIDHATGVVIGETTRIGDNVKIYQGVTLGAMSFPKDERGRVIKGLKRHPTIQDDVTIYANATILGGRTVIGKGVTIGGNAFVTSSVTADTTVVRIPPGLPARSGNRRR